MHIIVCIWYLQALASEDFNMCDGYICKSLLVNIMQIGLYVHTHAGAHNIMELVNSPKDYSDTTREGEVQDPHFPVGKRHQNSLSFTKE